MDYEFYSEYSTKEKARVHVGHAKCGQYCAYKHKGWFRTTCQAPFSKGETIRYNARTQQCMAEENSYLRVELTHIKR